MNGPNRRGDDPVIKRIADDLSTLSARYEHHVTRDDDTSLGALLRRNLPVLVALIIQAIAMVWWFGGFVGDVKRNQEVTNLKLSYLEDRIKDWYSKDDAARDLALRDAADADMRRRLESLENNMNRRSQR